MLSKFPVIYAPWRYRYIRDAASKPSKKAFCIFCEAPKKDDSEALILARGRYNFTIMNLFPYNTGHIMVIPYRHVSTLEELDDNELLEMMIMVKAALRALREALAPHGFNIGVNIGRIAGAGIEEHVHIHVVPRWNGDTNFMPVIAGVKVIPQDVKETYKLLKPYFEKYWQRSPL